MQAAMPSPQAPTGPELQPLHLPPDPNWFPPAPGWWIIAALLILLLVLALKHWQRRRRHRHWVGAARREWLALQARYAAGADALDSLRDLSALLRRAALRVDSRIAQLHGSAWAKWLDQQLGRDDFSQGPGKALIDAPYRPEAPSDLAVLINLAGELIRSLERRL